MKSHANSNSLPDNLICYGIGQVTLNAGPSTPLVTDIVYTRTSTPATTTSCDIPRVTEDSELEFPSPKMGSNSC
jgi:hypothetical protein